MRIHPDDLSSGYFIKQYDHSQITVVDKVFTAPFILDASSIISPWHIEPDNFINEVFISAIKKHKPHVVLLGTGRRQIFPEHSKLRQLAEMQVSLEVMDTGSACRTFNIIQAEGRKVLAGLII